jgi:sulfide:quinone oxidoreductase
VRHDDRPVGSCQLRREHEGITAFGVTGEGDENGREHEATVDPAVPTAIRERVPMRLWQSRSNPVASTDGLGRVNAQDVAMPFAPSTDTPRVVIAGGGVAALEACLALRDRLSAADLDITLLSPAEGFDYRPLSVLEPFGGISRWSLALATFAADQDVTVVRDALTAVGPQARVAVTGAGDEIPYDVLLVATGGHAIDAVHGALTFRGAGEGQAIRELLSTQPRSIAFAAPAGATWPLPLYELALLSAAELRRRGAATDVVLVTPEDAPLALFGAGASEFAADLLSRYDIEVVTSASAVAARAGTLELSDGRRLDAEHVIALPRLLGRRIEGVPRDHEDFIPIDEHARVEGLAHVYAAGDVTSFPFKHGSLAAQQADAAAEAMLAEIGLPIAPRPFDPVIQGVLFTDREPAYLQAPLADSAAGPSDPRAYSLWWPPSKIAGRHLSAYLAIRAGAPRTPEVRPDAVSVSVDVCAVAQSVRGTPPG